MQTTVKDIDKIPTDRALTHRHLWPLGELTQPLTSWKGTRSVSLGRVGPASHRGSPEELALVVQVWVSLPWEHESRRTNPAPFSLLHREN